jgi:hypothetical protein
MPTEAELLELIVLRLQLTDGILQWWASVSFAVIALAHFGRKSLNLPIVIVVLGSYIAFTLSLNSAFFMHQQVLDGHTEDLAAMASVSDVSESSKQYLNSMDSNAPVLAISFYLIAYFGSFLGSIFYLLYSYRVNRRGSSPVQSERRGREADPNG